MKTTAQQLQEVLEYFQDNDIDTTNSVLDLEQLAGEFNLTVEQIAVLCCNLEDQDTMQELVDGDYSTFDVWDEAQFNDGYYDVLDSLGLHDDDEMEMWDECNEEDDEDSDCADGPYGRIS